MTHKEEHKVRLNWFRRCILTVQVFIMALGLAIFILAVISRPILRITRTDYTPTVRWIVDVMAGAGLVQIVAASVDIVSSFCKSMWPVYLGIAGTSLTVFLELTAIGSSLYLYARSESMVNEDVVHPWYWVECQSAFTCHERMLNYIHWYVLPQVIGAAVTLILQCTTIFLLARLVKCIVEHHHILHQAGERYHDEWEEQQFNSKQEKSTKQSITTKSAEGHHDSDDDFPEHLDDSPTKKTPRRVQFSPSNLSTTEGSARKRGREKIEMTRQTSTFEAQIHAVVEISNTPDNSRLGTNGCSYVPGSRVSLDFDLDMGNENEKNKVNESEK